MSVYGAMLTAVTGLRAQGFALENISGNIANSRTVGFKRVDTTFVDLIPDTDQMGEQASSVRAFSRNTVTLQGDLTTSQVSTNMAINGQGMFVVGERSGFQGDLPVFSTTQLYTRRGDFEVNKDGHLVNGAGYFLKGIPLDPRTGALTGSQPGIIQISSDNLPARASTVVQYRSNLPSYPKTTSADPAVVGSELLTATGMSTDPRTTGAGTVAGQDVSAFLGRTIAGGAVTVYNAQGNAVNLQLRWGKVQSGSGSDVWNLFYQTNASATGTQVAWQNVGTPFTFNAAGALTSASSVSLPSVSVNGQTAGPVTLDFATNGLTQFADANGQVQVNTITQDGYASGVLESVAVGDGGRIVGTYSNGQVIGLAQVMLANFNGDNGLKKLDGGAFEQTMESGAPTITQGDRSLVGGALENSNADISEEFSRMILTQQAYSANTRVISTSQEMLQDVLNIVR